jgi:hypothetical protein
MPANSSDKSGPDERLEIALRARSDIQDTLFEMYKFLKAEPPILKDKLHQQAFQLLVGAAFSLWRAIFLAEADRDWSSLSRSMECFLHRVITDNTITYQDDKRNNAWTVGYYLGSAQLRIEKAWETLLKSPELSPSALTDPPSPTIADSWELNRTSTLFEWEVTHNSLRQALKLLKPDVVLLHRIGLLSSTLGDLIADGTHQ